MTTFIRYTRPEYVRAAEVREDNVLELAMELNANNDRRYDWCVTTDMERGLILRPVQEEAARYRSHRVGTFIDERGDKVHLTGWVPVDEEVPDV